MATTANNSGLRDNHTRGTVADFLRAKTQDSSQLSIVSAYFTIYAYDALKECLESIEHLDFLFGEPSFINRLDPDKTDKKAFLIDSEGLSMANKLQQKRIAKECADWIERKVDIKTIKQSNLLHGKMYHVATAGVEHAILGSSNFTVRGLGLGAAGNNIELNLVVDSNRDRAELKQWFDEIWGNSAIVKDVKAEVLAYLAKLYANQPPQLLYYLTLFHLFRDELEGIRDLDDALQRTTLLESQVWRALFSFQKDGVKGAINKILRFNGCVLADSVGLGKTFEALAVIKYFNLRNETVLVLCPKKLRENWAIFRPQHALCPMPQDRLSFDLLSHTDLSRTTGEADGHKLEHFNWQNYGLIVIDESHNFRNNSVGKEKEHGERRRTRYERLIEDVLQAGVKTKVLLLSATPVNNQIADLRNQISLIAGGDVAREGSAAYDAAFQETLGVPSVKETTRQAQNKFTHWTKKPAAQRNTRDLIHELGSDFFKLLDGLSIARSRSQIKRYYAKELAALGGFPERDKPRAEYPDIDARGQFVSFEEIDVIISGPKETRGTKEQGGLTLSLYHPSSFLRDNLPAAVREAYALKIGNFDQAGRERILIAMMKINFLKRLESSIDSFRLTLERTIGKIDTLKAKIETFQSAANSNPDYDFAHLSEADFDDLDLDPDDLKIGGKHKINLAHLKLPEWKLAVDRDRAQLQFLLDRARPISPQRDAKLLRVREIIEAKLAAPSINRKGEPIRKVIVFTAFADTAKYLWNHLAQPLHSAHSIHTALITGGGENQATLGKAEFNHILTNFSPRSKGRDRQPALPQDAEIDLLIATDCISEGQNLQDCDLLINYDIHWNPVRIIQRFGRIDRIGSQNARVSLVNFWPTADLDAYLNVKHRVEARMALVDLTATGEDNLLNTEQFEDLIETDLHYRNQQLKRLQTEILDLEDLNEENISLADFSLADFRMDLLRFLEANRDLLESSPLGLYAVVPPDPQLPVSAPGILFCLRQRGDERPLQVNPLAPHYLVYVRDDGTVRLTFAQPKQSLELLRTLTAGHPAAFEKLCDLFDARTQNGTDMAHENRLLTNAVESIKATFARRAAASLFSGRDGTLPKASETPQSAADLELITWLVIVDGKTD